MPLLDVLFFVILSAIFVISFVCNYNLGRFLAFTLFAGNLVRSIYTPDIPGLITSGFALILILQEVISERHKDKVADRLKTKEGAGIRIWAGGLFTAIGIFGLIAVGHPYLLIAGIVVLSLGLHQRNKQSNAA